MAQFSLSLINKHGTTVLTDYDTLVGKTAGLTFDEHLNLNVDGSTLDFSMLKYVYEGSQKVVNTPTVAITYGSIIKCLHNGHRYDFAVTDINYQFLAENLQLNISAQDYFQFETSKLGVGYTLTNDVTDPSYFGAQPIDAWVHKIIQDNNLRWNYIPINQANREWINTALSDQQKQYLFNTTSESEYWEYAATEYTLNKWVSFECSESSAFNALKQLASDNELIIMVDYSNHNFWFAPKHNFIFNGYYFNPQNNLQQLSIKGSAQNLVTVLNVSGPKDINNQEITLVPSLPASIMTWILSDDWLNTKYYPDLYASHTNNWQFCDEAAYTPWLENKLIDYSFFQSNHLLLSSEVQTIQEILYNKLRIINGRLLVQQQRYLSQYGEQYEQSTQDIINSEAISAGLISDVTSITNLVFSDNAACFAVLDQEGSPWLYWPPEYYPYTVEYGPITPARLVDERYYAGKLECPEAIGSYQLCSPSKPHDSLLQPFVIDANAYAYGHLQMFSLRGNTIDYCGSTEFPWVSLPTPDVFSVTRPEWCSVFQLTIAHTGIPYKIIQIHYKLDNDTLTLEARGKNTASSPETWSEWQNISPSWGIINWTHIAYFGDIGWAESSVYIRVTPKPEAVAIAIQTASALSDNLLLQWSYDTDTKAKIGFGISNGHMQFRLYSIHASKDHANQFYINNQLITASTYQVQKSSQSIPLQVKTWTEGTGNYIIQHLKILDGDLTVYGKLNKKVTNYCHIKRETSGGFAGTYLFNQLNNAIRMTQLSDDVNTKHSTIMADVLNQLCGARDGYCQTLGQQLYEFLNFWYKTYRLNTTNVYSGDCILKLQDVTMLPNTQEDIVSVGAPYYYGAPSTACFDEDDILFLKQVLLANGEDRDLLRTEVITYLQSSFSFLTEKWSNCYNAAMGLGIYWPQDWNNSKWLLSHTSLVRDQTQLITLLSPLILAQDNQLILNHAFFPILENNENVNKTVAWDSGGAQILYNTAAADMLYLQGKITVYYYNGSTISQSFNIKLVLNDKQGVSVHVVDGSLHSIYTFSFRHFSNAVLSELRVSMMDGGGGAPSKINFTFTIFNNNFSSLAPTKQLYTSYKFVDNQQYLYHPIMTVTDNTQLRPYIVHLTDNPDDDTNIYYRALRYHNNFSDQLRLYATTHNQFVLRSQPNIGQATIPAQILSLPIVDNSIVYSSGKVKAYPQLFNIYQLAQHPLYDTQEYYDSLKKHDEYWQTLYQDYPGIFRESTYTNSTATNSQELYAAAKAQLDNLSRPSFEYTLTGMDIYMYNSDFIPTKLCLGEQIRIDYRDQDQLTDTLNAALREPLYITGISHALRNDGDYQFTVTTRTATDSMVQRFAQLLSFGR